MLKRTLFALLVLMMAAAAVVQRGEAQDKKKAPTERSISGIVTDSAGAPVPGAIVQLENMKTQQVRSFIAKDKGDYYFQGLSTDTEYQLKAQFNGKESGNKSLSAFDTRAAAVINLQLKQ